MNKKYKSLFFEFVRYCFVGGIAFLVDFGTLNLFYKIIFTNQSKASLILSTAIAFIAGLIINYILSIIFVFRNSKNSGKSAKDFIIFTIIGVIGLILTEIGMYLGVHILIWDFRIVKCLVTAIVLIWNYIMRKIIIFK